MLLLVSGKLPEGFACVVAQDSYLVYIRYNYTVPVPYTQLYLVWNRLSTFSQPSPQHITWYQVPGTITRYLYGTLTDVTHLGNILVYIAIP